MFFSKKKESQSCLTNIQSARMKEKPLFEAWLKKSFPLIDKILDFDEKNQHYHEKIVDQMWTGWLGARNLA